MKTLLEIKDEVAQNHEYKNWAEVDGDFGRNDYFMIDEVAKRYAEETLQSLLDKSFPLSGQRVVDIDDILNTIKELK